MHNVTNELAGGVRDLDQLAEDEAAFYESGSIKAKFKKLEPEVIFEFVKGALTPTQETEFTARVASLNAVLHSARETGQIALQDYTRMMLAHCLRLQEAELHGYNLSIDAELLKEHMSLAYKVPVKLVELVDFDRPIPDNVRQRIARDGKLFDKLYVLAMFPVKRQTSDKAKIEKKDPILFGTTIYNPNDLIFMADWEDPYCNITLSSLVKSISKVCPDFDARVVPPLSREMVKDIMDGAAEAHERLKRTNARTWRVTKTLTEIENAKFSFELIQACFAGLWTSFRRRKKHPVVPIGNFD